MADTATGMLVLVKNEKLISALRGGMDYSAKLVRIIARRALLNAFLSNDSSMRLNDWMNG
jgi:hypothetical protein